MEIVVSVHDRNPNRSKTLIEHLESLKGVSASKFEIDQEKECSIILSHDGEELDDLPPNDSRTVRFSGEGMDENDSPPAIVYPIISEKIPNLFSEAAVTELYQWIQSPNRGVIRRPFLVEEPDFGDLSALVILLQAYFTHADELPNGFWNILNDVDQKLLCIQAKRFGDVTAFKESLNALLVAWKDKSQDVFVEESDFEELLVDLLNKTRELVSRGE